MLIGYCEQCQRIRLVNARNSFLAAGVVRGVCRDCEARDAKAKEPRR